MRSPVPRETECNDVDARDNRVPVITIASNIQSLFDLKRISPAVIAYFHPLNPMSRIQVLFKYIN